MGSIMQQSDLRLILLAAALATGGGGARAQSAPLWALPNFSDRLELRIANPGDTPLHTLAVIDIAAARRLAPQFPGTLALAVDADGPTRFLPSQVDAGSRGEATGAFVIDIALVAHEQKRVDVYYSTTLHDDIPWPNRVNAQHSYGYNRATAAIESEKIGYRTYGGLVLDVQAHSKGHAGLFNALIGYAHIASPSVEGQDVLHVGDTLGVGGIFLRAKDNVFRPPTNTPDYVHRAAKPGEPSYRVLQSGPLRALVEADIPHWSLGVDEVAARAIYEMREGEEGVRCHVWLTPVHLSRSYELGTGVRDLPSMHIGDSADAIALDGVQEEPVGRIGLGLRFMPQTAHRAGKLHTPEGNNEIVLFNNTLESGRSVAVEYVVAAAWQGSGWADPLHHVTDVLHAEAIEPVITVLQHSTTPHPERLESEAQ